MPDDRSKRFISLVPFCACALWTGCSVTHAQQLDRKPVTVFLRQLQGAGDGHGESAREFAQAVESAKTAGVAALALPKDASRETLEKLRRDLESSGMASFRSAGERPLFLAWDSRRFRATGASGVSPGRLFELQSVTEDVQPLRLGFVPGDIADIRSWLKANDGDLPFAVFGTDTGLGITGNGRGSGTWSELGDIGINLEITFDRSLKPQRLTPVRIIEPGIGQPAARRQRIIEALRGLEYLMELPLVGDDLTTFALDQPITWDPDNREVRTIFHFVVTVGTDASVQIVGYSLSQGRATGLPVEFEQLETRADLERLVVPDTEQTGFNGKQFLAALTAAMKGTR